MTKWQEELRLKIDAFGPPSSNYISGCFVDNEAKGPAIQKYQALLQRYNTPFNNSSSSAFPVRRLWNFLVQQESVQDVFVRAIFGKYLASSSIRNTNQQEDVLGKGEHTTSETYFAEPIRIIHKDQESITAFCINKVEPGLMTFATPKELQEVDVSLLLKTNIWFEDECELDILNLNKDLETTTQSSYLIIQTPKDV